MITPRRIVYVWDADYPWDVRTEKTCLALTEAGHDVHIVARNRKWSPVVERLPEATVHRMPPWHWAGQRLDSELGFPAFFSPRWANLIRNTVDEIGADVIIARDLPLCPTAIRVGRSRRIPVILDMAENYPAMSRTLWETGRHTPMDYVVRNPRMVSVVEDYCIRYVDHIVVVVEESMDRILAKGVPQSRLTVISNTPPRDRVGEMPPRPVRSSTDQLELVYMGNMEVPRGLVESIEAIAILRAGGRDARLRLIGKGRDLELLRTRARDLQLGEDAVEFLGYIESHREALNIVAAADIGLMPHRKCEAWDTTIPNKMFDYMAAGMPVLSSDTAPCARILNETGAGRTFKSDDAADLAEVALTLDDPAVREQIGLAGQAAIEGRYNWEYDTETFLRVIDDATRKTSTKSRR